RNLTEQVDVADRGCQREIEPAAQRLGVPEEGQLGRRSAQARTERRERPPPRALQGDGGSRSRRARLASSTNARTRHIFSRRSSGERLRFSATSVSSTPEGTSSRI